MDEFVLVRHAATDWSGRRYCGRTDMPLNEIGQLSATQLGVDLAPSLPGTVRIVSSPALRARQTAAALASAMSSDGPEVDDRWLETDFGAAEGLTYEELEAAFPQVAACLAAGDIGIDWPGGETATALAARVGAAWRDLNDRSGSWIVVSHGGPLRIAIALATGQLPSDVAVPAPGAVWRLQRNPGLAQPGI